MDQVIHKDDAVLEHMLLYSMLHKEMNKARQDFCTKQEAIL